MYKLKDVLQASAAAVEAAAALVALDKSFVQTDNVKSVAGAWSLMSDTISTQNLLFICLSDWEHLVRRSLKIVFRQVSLDASRILLRVSKTVLRIKLATIEALSAASLNNFQLVGERGFASAAWVPRDLSGEEVQFICPILEL